MAPKNFPIILDDSLWDPPEGWTWTKLTDVAKLESGHTPRKSVEAYWAAGDVPWISLKDIRAHHGKVISETTAMPTMAGIENSSARLLPAGTVVFSRDISVGFTTIMGRDMATSQHFANWICSGAIDNRWLMFAFMASRESLIRSGQGTTVKTIFYPALKSMKVCLPPVEDQRRIVSKIESLFARSRRAKEALDAIPPLLDRLRQSILAAAFRGDLTADWRAQNPDVEPADKLLERIRTERRRRWEDAQLAKMRAKGKEPKNDKWKAKYKEPEHSKYERPLPQAWCWAKIEEVADVGTGATPKRGNAEFWEGGTIPWVTSGALNSSEVEAATEFVTEAALRRTNLRLFPPGTLLVAMYGEGRTRGKCSELRLEASTNQAIAAIVGEDATSWIMKLLKRFLQSRYEETRAAGAGGVQPNLNLGAIRSISFPLIPKEEAELLQARTEALLARLPSLGSAYSRIKSTSKQLDASILASAFAGHLA